MSGEAASLVAVTLRRDGIRSHLTLLPDVFWKHQMTSKTCDTSSKRHEHKLPASAGTLHGRERRDHPDPEARPELEQRALVREGRQDLPPTPEGPSLPVRNPIALKSADCEENVRPSGTFANTQC